MYGELPKGQKVIQVPKFRIECLPGYTQMPVVIGRGTTVAVESFSHKMSDYWIEGREAVYMAEDGTFKRETLTSDGYVYATAFVDASPEVLFAYRKMLAERTARSRVEKALARTRREHGETVSRAHRISRGSWVRVIRGRKVAKGTVGRVFWIGDGHYGTRIGFNDADGNTHWTALSNVEKLTVAPETVRRAMVAA